MPENIANFFLNGFGTPYTNRDMLQNKLHDLRKQADAVIEKVKNLVDELGEETSDDDDCYREADIALSKFQEGKMWLGKCLEVIGSPFPEELRDKAENKPQEIEMDIDIE